VLARPEGHTHPQFPTIFFWETGFGFLLEFLSGQFLFLFFFGMRHAALRRQLKGKTAAISKLTTGFVYAFSRLRSTATGAAAVT